MATTCLRLTHAQRYVHEYMGKKKIEKYWEKTYTYIINEGDIYKDNIANENTQLTAHSPLLITLMNLQTFISLILFFMLISLPNLA